MDWQRITRTAAALLATTLLVALSPLTTSTAAAITPPSSDIADAPPDGPPGPDTPMRRNDGPCVHGGVLANSDLLKPPPPLVSLRIAEAHKFSTGAGVTVAVIDTGVAPQPRLPGMIPGGDYVDSGDGFEDCAAHGTIVAGIIGASPAPTDGLIGVAPGAQILAIRQTSPEFTPQNVSADPNDPNSSRTAGRVRTLARAIVHAANLGAKVINISVVACFKPSTPVDQAMLGGALRYAVEVKDVLVVAAAGNTDNNNIGQGSACESNPDVDPARPGDPRNWGGVTSVSTPSWFDDLVLSVGFVSPDGRRAEKSMAGPWVDVAAPGTGVVSLSNTGEGVINALPGNDNLLVPIAGSSFAAAYVSGTAALLRSRFPDLNARQIATRIILTAHEPARGADNTVGRGIIDPVAALTWDVPIEGRPALTVQSAELAIPPPPPPPDTRPQLTALVVVGGAALAAIGLAVVVVATGARRGGRG